MILQVFSCSQSLFKPFVPISYFSWKSKPYRICYIITKLLLPWMKGSPWNVSHKSLLYQSGNGNDFSLIDNVFI